MFALNISLWNRRQKQDLKAEKMLSLTLLYLSHPLVFRLNGIPHHIIWTLCRLLTLARQMEECDTVSQSVFITNIVTTPMMPWPLAGAVTGPVWRRYLFICSHQICIQLVNNTQWQLNGPVCTQNIEPTRALFGLDICSILSFPWTQRSPLRDSPEDGWRQTAVIICC